MDESLSRNTVTERYSDEYIAEIVAEADARRNESGCNVQRRWYQNKVLSVIGAVGLGLLAGANAGCKKKDGNRDLETYSAECFGAENGKQFISHNAKLEKECVDNRKAWVIERKTDGLIDLHVQKDGLKTCIEYGKFLSANVEKANVIRVKTHPKDKKRGICRKLWQKLKGLVGKNETENVLQLESNY